MSNATLGGQPVQYDAPAVGALDPFEHDEHDQGLWGLDVETTALTDAGWSADDFQVRTVQLAGSDHHAWVLRMDDPDQYEVARAVLADPANTFACHTPIDVHAVWRWFGIDLSPRFIDTRVLAVMAAPDDTAGQASLKPVAARFAMPELGRAEDELDQVFDELYRRDHPEVGKRAIKKETLKGYGFTNVAIDDPTFTRYGALDALTARRLVPELSRATNNPPHVLSTEAWLSGEGVRLERTGCLVDVERLEELAHSAQVQENAASLIVAEHTNGLKTTQSKALQAWLSDHGVDWSTWPATMRTALTTKGGGGNPSLAKENIHYLRQYSLDESGQAVVGAMIEHAKISDKLNRTKQVRSAMDSNNVVHPTLYTVGTVTSRMSASQPNMQNFSKKDPEMRGMFIARPGYRLLTCDFAQIELRVLAALAGEQSMIDVIMAGGDLHQLTADLLGVLRQAAKTINFLIVYGGGGGRLAAQLNHTISEQEGRRIVREYWAQYPAIGQLNRFMKEQRSVRLISGRFVPVGDRSHAAMNYLIQGSARELLVGAWRRFVTLVRHRGLDARIWFPIHDELVIEVRADHAAEVAQLAGECMSFDFYGVPVQAEADEMIDPAGVSRWTTGDQAKEWAELRAA